MKNKKVSLLTIVSVFLSASSYFHWKATKRTWTHTLGDGNYTFNNGWLKRL